MPWAELDPPIPGTALVKGDDDTPQRRRCIATEENLDAAQLKVEFQDLKASVYRTDAGPFPTAAVIESADFTPDEQVSPPPTEG